MPDHVIMHVQFSSGVIISQRVLKANGEHFSHVCGK